MNSPTSSDGSSLPPRIVPGRSARKRPHVRLVAPYATEKSSDLGAIDNAAAGLEAWELRKAFRRRPVVRGVSLRLRRGEAVGLLGPNGAGKTTCFHLIAGLLPLDSGKITVDGTELSSLPMFRRARLGVGYLPQESSIFRGLSVEDNIRAILEYVEQRKQLRSKFLNELLAEFSLSHLRRVEAISLSGGERRRLEIARCLASRPQYLLLDEPFAGVDPKVVGEMRGLVAHLTDHGIGVLITDHNARETFKIVDRVYVIHEGEVISEGTPDEVVDNSEVRDFYLGSMYAE